MSAWKNSDWSNIISEVNGLAINPPRNQCDYGPSPLEPLPMIGPDHKWSKDDIRAVRRKLLEMRDDNRFEAPLVKWSESIISEMEWAILIGWKHIDEETWQDYDVLAQYVEVPISDSGQYTKTCCVPVEENPTAFEYGMRATVVWSWEGQHLTFGPLEMQVGPAGIPYRRASIYYHLVSSETRDGEVVSSFDGNVERGPWDIGCDGVLRIGAELKFAEISNYQEEIASAWIDQGISWQECLMNQPCGQALQAHQIVKTATISDFRIHIYN
jgi:hypothetical protein